jgi:hypothetical protein
LECRAWAAPQRAAQAAARDAAISAVLGGLLRHHLPLATDTVLIRDAPDGSRADSSDRPNVGPEVG